MHKNEQHQAGASQQNPRSQVAWSWSCLLDLVEEQAHVEKDDREQEKHEHKRKLLQPGWCIHYNRRGIRPRREGNAVCQNGCCQTQGKEEVPKQEATRADSLEQLRARER